MDLDPSEPPLQMPAAPAPEGAPAAPLADPATPAPAKPTDAAKPDDSERVIELARANREHERVRKEAEGKATVAEQQVRKLEPVLELLRLAETDPMAAIREMADVMGLSPERVLEAMQTHGAGGDAELTAEDKIARLERQLEELCTGRKPEEKAADPAAEQARQGFLDTFSAILEATPEKFPHAAKDADAPEAAFLVMVRHWEQHKSDPKYRPLPYAEALGRVERALAPAAAPTGGLASRTAGPVIPETDRILSDAEIRADMLRRMSR
jgi:methylphosphotriester-DNA--protein-cysteine methyltransferase